ncbi:hypothetical protein [Sorangium sp. So ce1151]|uniref:hypothetical protein n=1 Tax=Sorangium sp. So ce1151 TaxID=3133332 RepID=UPI003F63FC1C
MLTEQQMKEFFVATKILADAVEAQAGAGASDELKNAVRKIRELSAAAQAAAAGPRTPPAVTPVSGG